jgi:hypothetical protein
LKWFSDTVWQNSEQRVQRCIFCRENSPDWFLIINHHWHPNSWLQPAAALPFLIGQIDTVRISKQRPNSGLNIECGCLADICDGYLNREVENPFGGCDAFDPTWIGLVPPKVKAVRYADLTFGHRDIINFHPWSQVGFHYAKLAFHYFKLAFGCFSLPTGIYRERNCQTSDCSGRCRGNEAIMSIYAAYKSTEWPQYKLPKRTIDEPLSVLGCALIIAFGYFSLAWGGGTLLLWQNPLGLLCGGIAIVLGIACFGHGLWTLVH